MKVDNLAELSKLTDAMKARGVRAFEVDGIRVEFHAVDAAPMDPLPLADDGPTKCKCGHAPYEHQNGLCLQCAEPSLCLQPAAAS